MQILIVIDAAGNLYGATPILARRIADELAQTEHVTVIESACNDEQRAWLAKRPNTVVYTSEGEGLLNEIVMIGRRKGHNNVRIAWDLLCHPSALWAAFTLKVLKNSPARRACKSAIQKVAQRQSFDVAIAFSAPYSAALALMDAKPANVLAPCFFDPFSTGEQYTTQRDRALEIKLCQRVQHLFVTEIIRTQYEAVPALQKYLPKLTVLPFPGIVRHAAGARPSFLQTDTINLVFVGNLYPQVRDPSFLLQLFAAMHDPRLRLYIVGGLQELFPNSFWQPYEKMLGARLCRVGQLPSDEAFAVMQHADILVNIGNDNASQLPSKVFDYMSCGRPVLHLQKREDDPCVPFFSRYSLCCTVKETEEITKEVCERVVDFCVSNAHNEVPFETVKDVFEEYTPNQVAKTILANL